MDELDLIDETFDKDRTEVYELSIQVSLNGFSFAVKDTIRNTYIVLVSKQFSSTIIGHEKWASEVDKMVLDYPILTQKFKRVLFSYALSQYTIVPNDLFVVERIKDLFELTQPLPDQSELHHTSVTNGSSYVLIFSMPYSLSTAWLKIQSKTKFVAPVTPLFFNADILRVDKLMQIYFSEQQLSIVYHEDEKFVASNAYNYRTVEDAAYYILSFCKGLKLDFSQVNVHVLGYSINNDDISKLLQNYFAQVSSDIHYNSIHFSYQLLRHRVKYYTLFNATAICE
ncbi:MAG: DUF3822 family protein [Bacteroidales bacterium]